MKMNKKALVSSLATVAAVAGTLAPVASAFAADTYKSDKTGVDTNFESVSLKERFANGTGTANMGQFATSGFQPGTADNGKTSGFAVAQSNAQVQVIQGVLSLDAVPDFNFGTALPGTTQKLHNNYGAKTKDGDDGNFQGLLQVTDSRVDGTEAAPERVGQGYALSLAVGKFTPSTTNVATNSMDAQDKNAAYSPDEAAAKAASAKSWALNFNSLKFTTSANYGGNTKWDATTATTGNTNPYTFEDNATFKPLFTAAAGHSYGTSSTSLTGANDVTLSVPDDASNGGYDAVLYWALAPKVSASVNGAVNQFGGLQ